MMDPSPVDLMDYLMRRRYGVRESYTVSGPSSPPMSRERLAEKEAYRSELQALPMPELAAMVEAERKKEATEWSAAVARHEAARPYNRPSAAADFHHWAKSAFWTLDEAVALALGREPRAVRWNEISPLVAISEFAARFGRLRDLVRRSRLVGELTDPVAPAQFLEWASRLGIEVPAELATAVREIDLAAPRGNAPSLERVPSASSEASGRKDADLGGRERDTAYKLVLAMAIKGYGYDPGKRRSDIAKEIAGDVAALGYAIDEDTVRNWLKKAAQHLSYVSEGGT